MSAIERLATTLGPELMHPTPLRLLALFAAKGRLSPKDCALAFARAELGPDATDKQVSKRASELLGSVAYHVRELHKAKLLKPAGTRHVRGAIRHFYVLAPEGETRHEALLELLKEVPVET